MSPSAEIKKLRGLTKEQLEALCEITGSIETAALALEVGQRTLKRELRKHGIKFVRGSKHGQNRIDPELQAEILRLVAEGHRKVDIARRLNVSERTVYNYLPKNLQE